MFRFSEIREEISNSLALGIPLVMSELIYGLSNFFATAMIAHLGKEQLAANSLVWTIYMSITIFFYGLLCSTGILVAQSFGAADKGGISTSFKQGIIMALIFSLPMMIMIWISASVLIWAKQDPAVVALAKPFFNVLVFQMLPLNISIVIQQFLVGIGKARLVMLINIIAVPIEIFFFYGFIFGKFGLPRIGLAGIGYGLVISYFVMTLLSFVYLLISIDIKPYRLFNNLWIINKKFFVEMLHIGTPLGFMWFSEMAFFAMIAIMMGVLGINVLAAFQVTNQYLVIALVILFAIGQTASIRSANEVGKNNSEQIKLVTLANLIIAICIIGGLSAFYLVFPDVAIKMDIDINSKYYAGVVVEILKFFPLMAILLFVDCVRIVSSGTLRGLRDIYFQMIVCTLGYWMVAFPLGYIFAFKLGLGGVGIWWGIIIGQFINGALLISRYLGLKKFSAI